MSPRALELFDLPKLPRYRETVITLDNRRALTRGNPLRAESFISYLNPKQHIYTAIIENEKKEDFIGGIVQRAKETSARLAYLAPANAPLALIEHLTAHAGNWKARQVLAEIDENAPTFESLRRCGFAVYSHQQIWDLSKIAISTDATFCWRKIKDVDLISIQSLQRKIIPPILQQVENFANSSDVMVCEADELMAYIDITYGTQGIFLRPLIHPNIKNLREKLLNFVAHLPSRRDRRVYICLRSHQAWIGNTLEELGGEAGNRQAVMVKYLVKYVRDRKTVPVRGDKAWASPAATIRGNSIVVEREE